MCKYNECEYNEDFVCFYDWDNGLPEYCYEIEEAEEQQAHRLTYPLPFLERNAQTQMARSLRLAIIQQQYTLGNLTEEEARGLLCAPLTPGDQSTFYDDSNQLKP